MTKLMPAQRRAIVSRPRTLRASTGPGLGLGLGLLAAGLPTLAAAQDTTVSAAEVRSPASGYTPREPALSKLTGRLVDTPQAITTLTRQELDDRGVNTLNDALRNVPGISLGAGETSFQGGRGLVAHRPFRHPLSQRPRRLRRRSADPAQRERPA